MVAVKFKISRLVYKEKCAYVWVSEAFDSSFRSDQNVRNHWCSIMVAKQPVVSSLDKHASCEKKAQSANAPWGMWK